MQLSKTITLTVGPRVRREVGGAVALKEAKRGYRGEGEG